MNQTISQRLALLRDELRREHLSAFIFPTSDPHNSEYTAERWKSRQWISGFDGSAGTAVVTLTGAALWTDSRYFLAAEQQLVGTEYRLMRLKVDGTPTIAEWLRAEGCREVGIDGTLCPHNEVVALKEELRRQGGLTLRTNLDIVGRIWTDRPPMPLRPIEVQPLQLAGEDVASKLQRIRQALRQQHADGTLLTTLDDIAWTLNLRGSDVHCCPVFISYLLISSTQAVLFVDRRQLSDAVSSHLSRYDIAVADYADAAAYVHRHYPDYNILLDGDQVNDTLYQYTRAQQIINAPSPVPLLKAVKNAAEQEGLRQAHVRDGVAMVRFLKWLKPAVAKGGQTEMSIDRQLTQLRAAQPLYRGLSFDTIAAYEAHGAIVHYEATPETDAALRPEGLLLLDSGAQYQDGTTDITRTIALGSVSDEQRHVYTLVLKGHIALQRLIFPDGASGTQLDAVARQPLWREGLNYLHGTGHGVGAYLNVHEGPHQIRMEWKPTPMRAGMTVTDEPGFYLAGRFGVRIENTLLTLADKETEFGRFLAFEPLTLCPIDTDPIDRQLLSADEAEWLNQYHAMVYEKLAPHLDDEEREWLRQATRPI